MCQVTVVSPLLFRRHWTERPTWSPEGTDLDLLRWGVAVSPRGATSAPARPRPTSAPSCAPRITLGRGCAVSAPLPSLSGPRLAPGHLCLRRGDFPQRPCGHRRPSTVSWQFGQKRRALSLFAAGTELVPPGPGYRGTHAHSVTISPVFRSIWSQKAWQSE